MKKRILTMSILVAFCLSVAACEKISLEEYNASRGAPKPVASTTPAVNPVLTGEPEDKHASLAPDWSNWTYSNVFTPEVFSDITTKTPENKIPLFVSNIESAFEKGATKTDDDLISAKDVAVYNINKGELVYSKISGGTINPAAAVRIVVALTASEILSPSDELEIGSEIKLSEFPFAELKEGNKISFLDALTAMLTGRGGDAAYTIAINAARKNSPDLKVDNAEAKFVELMNTYINDKLNITSGTKFIYPDCAESSLQITNLKDLVTIAAAAAENPVIVAACEGNPEWEANYPEIGNAKSLGFCFANMPGWSFQGYYEGDNGDRYIVVAVFSDRNRKEQLKNLDELIT